MEYTITIKKVNNNSSNKGICAFASVVFDNRIKVEGITICKNSDSEELFVNMPRYRSNELDGNGQHIYKDICNPITKDYRERLYGYILSTYNNYISNLIDTLTFSDDAVSSGYTVKCIPSKDNNSTRKAEVRVYVADCFVINHISVLDGKKGIFVSMPSYKTTRTNAWGKASYRNYCYPVTKEFREELFSLILNDFKSISK